MRQNLDRFKLRWRDRLDGWGSADQGALEREYAQSYWSELFECFGVTAYRYVTDLIRIISQPCVR